MAQEPQYLQIVDDLRSQIQSGTLAEGSRLPTQGELGQQYGCSRNTIKEAIKRLVSEGLVENRLGQGTFVTLHPFVTTLSTGALNVIGGGEGWKYFSEVTREHRRPSATTPKVEVQTPPEVIAKRLRIGPAVQVISRHQARYIDDTPWSLQTSFYPMDFIKKGATRLLMAEDIHEGTMEYLAHALGVRQIGYRDWITARLADDNEQRFFGVSRDSVVFVIFRTVFDATKTPIRLTVTVFPADRNQFVVNFGGDLPDPAYDEEIQSAD